MADGLVMRQDRITYRGAMVAIKAGHNWPTPCRPRLDTAGESGLRRLSGGPVRELHVERRQ